MAVLFKWGNAKGNISGEQYDEIMVKAFNDILENGGPIKKKKEGGEEKEITREELFHKSVRGYCDERTKAEDIRFNQKKEKQH